MKFDFAALRFVGDPNLSDRAYWYLAEFPLSAGERVLAPVGVHDKLQCALVERTVRAEESAAPYDLRLIKRVTAKLGARKLVAGENEFLEFGGVRYDEKHFTPFGRVLLARRESSGLDGISAYGFTKQLDMRDEPALYEEIASTTGGVVLKGEAGAAAFARLIAFVRGEPILGVSEETLARLKEKLL